MRSCLHDAPRIKHIDDIRLLDRAESVGDRNRRAPLRGRVERRLHNLLALRVERAGGLVEEEDLGVSDQCAGDCNTLLLASGEEGTLGPADCRETFWQ